MLSNLKNHENQDLRRKILTSEIDPQTLVLKTADELAPFNKKQMIEKQREEYLKQSVMLQPEKQKFIIKNNKGEEIEQEEPEMNHHVEQPTHEEPKSPTKPEPSDSEDIFGDKSSDEGKKPLSKREQK